MKRVFRSIAVIIVISLLFQGNSFSAAASGSPAASLSPNLTPSGMPGTGEKAFDLPPTTRYVLISGNDGEGNNDCATIASPCRTIQRAVNASGEGDIIKVGTGTYTVTDSGNPTPNVVIISKSLTLSGGWNDSFTSQTASSTIDGEDENNGILAISHDITVQKFVIQNSVSSNSGGIYLTSANLTLESSTVKNNRAWGDGGGIYVTDLAHLSLINSTVTNNIAAYGSGGIHVASGTVQIDYSTVAYNQSGPNGAGIGIFVGTLEIKNSILANNSYNVFNQDCFGTIHSLGHNLISHITTACDITAGSGDLFDVNPQIDSSLSHVPPIHALLPGSPAIDAGDPEDCLQKDEIDTYRPIDGDQNGTATCDIGANEYAVAGVPITVTVSSGSGQKKSTDQNYDLPLIALVQDGLHEPVAGIDVTFTAPATGPSGAFTANGSNEYTVASDELGFAESSTFTANNIAGSYLVAAAAEGVPVSASFQLRNLGEPGIPTQITVVSGSDQSALSQRAFEFPLSAIVLNINDDPVGGVDVTFTAPDDGASGTFSNGSSPTETVTTGLNGIATASAFIANSQAGDYSVHATYSGGATPAAFNLHNIGQTYMPLVVAPVRSPQSFHKISPTNGSLIEYSMIVIYWESAAGAESYDYCWDTTNNNSCDTTWISTGTSTLANINGLIPSSTYYWQVKAHNAVGVTPADGGTWWSFNTGDSWTTIISDNFEGNFPGIWKLEDNTSSGYSWGKRNCRSFGGGFSAWAVGGGSLGASLPCISYYPNNVESWMTYGPFSLTDATSAELAFRLFRSMAPDNQDSFCVGASIDGDIYWGDCITNYSGSWESHSLNLGNVYHLGNLLGKSQVWINFLFYSNGQSNYYDGAMIDNVILRKCITNLCLRDYDQMGANQNQGITHFNKSIRILENH